MVLLKTQQTVHFQVWPANGAVCLISLNDNHMKLKNLPAGEYSYLSSSYTAILDGGGWACENCGRLIANLVTVKHEGGKTFIIGQDCAKTLFSDTVNKGIDQTIKADKRRQKKAVENVEREKRSTALKELRQLEVNAGIDNTNINSEWARAKYNELLSTMEAKHGFYISFKR